MPWKNGRTSMIEIIGATKRFGGKEAISNLSLIIDKGLIGLVGQNGAGKSTLFRLISGVEYVDEGAILIDSFLPTTRQAKEKIFFLPDDPCVPGRSDIQATLEFYATFYEIDTAKFWDLIAKFDLPTDKSVNTFSKGMRRQVFIVLALSIKCDILLLDEAFDGLDPLVMEKIKYELLNIYDKQNKTIVISTHNVYALEKLVDKFIVIHDGRLQSNNTLEHLGETFIKFQAIFSKPCDANTLLKLGLEVVSFRKVGSIDTFVLDTKMPIATVEKLLESLEPTLLETISIDANEIVMLQMMTAEKEKSSC